MLAPAGVLPAPGGAETAGVVADLLLPPPSTGENEAEDLQLKLEEEKRDRSLGTTTPYRPPKRKPISEQLVVGPNGATYRYCRVCRLWIPLRARHCKQCSRCVSRYDHHCFWIGPCWGGYTACLRAHAWGGRVRESAGRVRERAGENAGSRANGRACPLVPRQLRGRWQPPAVRGVSRRADRHFLHCRVPGTRHMPRALRANATNGSREQRLGRSATDRPCIRSSCASRGRRGSTATGCSLPVCGVARHGCEQPPLTFGPSPMRLVVHPHSGPDGVGLFPALGHAGHLPRLPRGGQPDDVGADPWRYVRAPPAHAFPRPPF